MLFPSTSNNTITNLFDLDSGMLVKSQWKLTAWLFPPWDLPKPIDVISQGMWFLWRLDDVTHAVCPTVSMSAQMQLLAFFSHASQYYFSPGKRLPHYLWLCYFAFSTALHQCWGAGALAWYPWSFSALGFPPRHLLLLLLDTGSIFIELTGAMCLLPIRVRGSYLQFPRDNLY